MDKQELDRLEQEEYLERLGKYIAEKREIIQNCTTRIEEIDERLAEINEEFEYDGMPETDEVGELYAERFDLSQQLTEATERESFYRMQLFREELKEKSPSEIMDLFDRISKDRIYFMKRDMEQGTNQQTLKEIKEQYQIIEDHILSSDELSNLLSQRTKSSKPEVSQEVMDWLEGRTESITVQPKRTEKVSLEWYETIKQMNLEGKKLSDIPDEEKALYQEQFGELKYNWDAIYYAIFQDKAKGYEDAKEDMEIPTCAIPSGMKEFFEIDESGNPTGKYNWEYIKQLVKESSGHDITEYNNMNIANDNGITCYMPTHAALVLENLDNPSKLYDNLISGGLDTNCPNDVRENQETTLEIFENAEWDEISYCWDLMSEDLKKDKDFLLQLMDLASVRESTDIISQIDPALYENDEEFKKAMINCWGLSTLFHTWDKTEELWEYAMEQLGDEEFFESASNFDLELIESHNPKFAKLVELEIAKREGQELEQEEQSISETEHLIEQKENQGQSIDE